MKNSPNLLGVAPPNRHVLCLIACFLSLCGFASAQGNLVAFGRIAPGGGLDSSYNAVGGDIQVSKGGVGIFEIEISSPGAFAGATTDDFHVGLTVHSASSNDDAGVADVSFVDADTLTIDVYTSDLEDDTSTSNPLPRDVRFFFQIYRIPAGGVASRISTGVLATGFVVSDGTLIGGVTADGASIQSTQLATGEYEITVSGSGLFATDAIEDYSLALTIEAIGDFDEVIRGRASDVSSNNEAVFDIFVDDAQETSDDNNPDPTDRNFGFVIYRVSTLPPSSALLGAIARVDSGGNLLSGASSFPGGSIQSEQNLTGEYTLTVNAPDAFVGKKTQDYSLQLQIHDVNAADEFAKGRVLLKDSNTMEVRVFTTDVEQNNEFGTPSDGDFSLLIMEISAEVQSDMLVGKKSVDAAMIGEDVYSLASGSQKLRVKSKKSGRSRFFFRVENDGNLTRGVAVGKVGRIKGLKPKIFLLTGGRSNVTAAVKSGGAIVPGMSPDSGALFEAKTKPKRKVKKRTKIRLLGIDVASGAAQDLILAKLKLRR